MHRLKKLWLQFFDIRPGEHGRTLFMFLYLLCVLFAYYILKPVARAMFLNRFDIEKLPYLILLVAAGGGLLAYVYSKVVVRASLRVAVTWTMFLAVGCLAVMWYLIRLRLPWMIYVLNVWVSLFSISLVSQGWLVASNLFTSREAKRLYGLLGMGTVLGAAAGGEFTRRTAVLIGTENLLLACAGMVLLAYVAFRLAAAQRPGTLAGARAGTGEQARFAFRDVVRDISHTRHLQVIIGIMVLIYVVDTMVDFQFQAMAQAAYKGDHLTAFFGRFYGIYLNTIDFVVQFFLTALIVRHVGVGGTLQIMPVSIMLASLASVFRPSVVSTAVVRLTESCTRYTLNRTGIELLYLPLPIELRNRIKAFVDIFFDRMSRGLGSLILIFMTSLLDMDNLGPSVRVIALVVIGLTLPWVLMSLRARKEYVATIRRRLEARRLDLAAERITVNDPGTVRVLEQAAAGNNARQAVYALSMLSEAPGYDLRPQLRRLAGSEFAEVRAKMYELARAIGFPELLDRALQEVRGTSAAGNPAMKAAVAYALSVAPQRAALAGQLLEQDEIAVSEGVLEALAGQAETAWDLITHQWIAHHAGDPDPRRRALAAQAIGVCGDQGTEALYRLLDDPDLAVVAAACRAGSGLRSRSYVHAMVNHLANPRLRGLVIEALAGYGPQIVGTLGDMLADEHFPMRVRRQIPRVLKSIPHQRSVDALLPIIGHPDIGLRAAALKALNRLRETAPRLNFENMFLTQQILNEAHYYFELNAALAPFREQRTDGRRPTGLLARTIEERLRQTLDRLFRLLGLRYPPKEIYSSYLAVSRRRAEDAPAALEFLDNVLERDLKRILLPLLDAPDRVLEKGRDLFGVEVPDAEAAIRDLIQSQDPWLAVCAIAAAAELRLRSLAPEIARAAQKADAELSEVARSAQMALA